jgi:putative hydrolase
MKFVLDTHTHTLASGHAYCTIKEMVAYAAEMGLEGIAITDHAPEMPGSCHKFYFHNIKIMPRKMSGIDVLFGSEVNIMDEEGTVDLHEKILGEMDIVIASIHPPCFGESRGIEGNTKAVVNAMKNPGIDIIGHPDDGRYELDYEVIVDMAKATGTLLEINNSSIRPGGFRKNTYENARKILELCKEKEVMVVLGSDAHVDVEIADTTYSSKVVREVGFPEELIANTSLEKLRNCLKRNQKSKI